MTSPLANMIDGLQEVLGICPCCGELFRLAEAKFIFPQRKRKNSSYFDLIAMENGIAELEESVSQEEDAFDIEFEAIKERLREVGRQQAKAKLMKIDPLFSGNKIDPQEVKALMHPVEYVIFHGLCSTDGVTGIEFINWAPRSRSQEIIVTAIEKAVNHGNVTFETLRMNDDGSFDITIA